MALYLYFQASEKSSCKLPDPRGPLLEINTFVVDRICLRENAECVGRQGAHSEWAKGTTLLQARSRTEGQKSAGWQQSTSWLLQSGYMLKGYPIFGRWVWLIKSWWSKYGVAILEN